MLAAGYSQNLIDEIHRIKEEFIILSENQQVFKKRRVQITNDRRIALNALWEIILNISRAGKIIFANDYGRYTQYVIYKTKSAKRISPNDLDNKWK